MKLTPTEGWGRRQCLLEPQRVVPTFDQAGPFHLIEINHKAGTHRDRPELVAECRLHGVGGVIAGDVGIEGCDAQLVRQRDAKVVRRRTPQVLEIPELSFAPWPLGPSSVIGRSIGTELDDLPHAGAKTPFDRQSVDCVAVILERVQ